MNSRILLTWFSIWSTTGAAFSQGTFVYDQQSSLFDVPGEGVQGIGPALQPVGQSFVPDLNAVGFIRLLLYDADITQGSGATMLIHLRSTSITGPVLGSTDPVVVPNGLSAGLRDFFFSTPVSVTPGTTYYFQPEIQSGDAFAVGGALTGFYPKGTAFVQGLPRPNNDLWFREGIYNVPEPSIATLGVFGGAWLVWMKRRRFRAR